eukprot:COSAG04_NODE_15996_length_513_cov_0.746377_1_plen_61_part_01
MSSSKFLVPRLLKRYDNKGAFELWSVVAIVSYLAVSQVILPTAPAVSNEGRSSPLLVLVPP